MKAPSYRQFLRIFGHLRFIKTPLRERIISRFHAPSLAENEAFSVNFNGFVYNGQFDSYLDWAVYYFGFYAREEMRLFRDVLEALSNSTMLDVGGNCGHHALFCSKYAAEVYTFEPLQRFSQQIEEKISTNRIKNIRIGKYGLGEKNTELVFYPPHDNHTGLGSFVVKSDAKPIILPIRNGDELVREEMIENIGFIKIDVEGFEVPVVRGLAETISKNRPVIFIEWTQASQTLLGDISFMELLPRNYEVFVFIDNSYVPRWKAFRAKKYSLVKLDPTRIPAEVNLLLIPLEVREKFKTCGAEIINRIRK